MEVMKGVSSSNCAQDASVRSLTKELVRRCSIEASTARLSVTTASSALVSDSNSSPAKRLTPDRPPPLQHAGLKRDRRQASVSGWESTSTREMDDKKTRLHSPKGAHRAGALVSFPLERERDIEKDVRTANGVSLAMAASRKRHEMTMLWKLTKFECNVSAWNLSMLRAIIVLKKKVRQIRERKNVGQDALIYINKCNDQPPSRIPRQAKTTNTSGKAAAHRLLLEQRLENTGLVRLSMASDGNCQFRSAASELFGDPERHNEVRAACVAYMRDNPGKFSFLFDSQRQFTRYCGKMGRDREWGDEITIRALSNIYNVNVHVLTSDKAAFYHVYTPEPVDEKTPSVASSSSEHIFIVYFNRCHYDVLSSPEYHSRRRSDIADSARLWIYKAS